MLLAQLEAMADLLAEMAGTSDPWPLAKRWGEAIQRGHNAGVIEVSCPPQGPFQSLAIRPWTTDNPGHIDVVFPGQAPASWAALQTHFGPFRSGIPFPAASGASVFSVYKATCKGDNGVDVTIEVERQSGDLDEVLELSLVRGRARD